jgi:hypothetical protein
MSFISPNDARLFIQRQSPWTDVAPTFVTADGLEFMEGGARFIAESNPIESRVLTGSLGRRPDRRGRRKASFEIEVPLRGSGTAGTASDMDPILAALFGAEGTVNPGVSITYAIAEANIGIGAALFRDPAGTNIWNEILVGGLIDGFEILGGGAEVESSLKVTGPAVDVIDKPNFSSLTTAEKRGLGAFPTEPAAATFLSQPALGFTGSATINAVGTFSIESFRIFGSFGRSIRYAHGNYYNLVPIGTRRKIGVEFRVHEEDTAAQAALRHLARTVGTYDVSIVIGEDAGNIHTFNLNNVSGGTATRDEGGAESVLSFAGNASITSVALNDELTYVAT